MWRLRRWAVVPSENVRRLVGTAPHEFAANMNFNGDGLKPWFAADRQVKRGGGSVEAEGVELDCLNGDRADVKLYYQQSGLLPPEGNKTLAGTPVEHESIREFRLHVRVRDDVGERKANFHIRPRWANLCAESNDGTTTEIPVPDDLANRHSDAVSVRATGSNIEFDRYPALLREAADAVGIAGDYFIDLHHTSNIQDAARYVRIDRNASGPIHAHDSILVSLAHVLHNDRNGYRKFVQNDADHHGNRLPGFYHTVTLGPTRIREVFPSHALPKEVKHYYESEAHDRHADDPLAHPKLEAAYQVSRWNDTLHFDALNQLTRELDETLYGILADAGLDLRAGGPYVEDAYFDARDRETVADVIALDVSQVKYEQENIVVRHLADGLSPVEQEALETLVTDGGAIAPKDIAEEHDRHLDAVYDALDRMDGLLDREYGAVSLRSTYVAELVHDAVTEAREALSRAADATGQALAAAERGVDERTEAFAAFAAKHFNFEERDDAVRIDFGRVETDDGESVHKKVRRLLREGFDLWTAMNRDEHVYRAGRYQYTYEETVTEYKSLDKCETRTVTESGKVWRALR